MGQMACLPFRLVEPGGMGVAKPIPYISFVAGPVSEPGSWRQSEDGPLTVVGGFCANNNCHKVSEEIVLENKDKLVALVVSIALFL